MVLFPMSILLIIGLGAMAVDIAHLQVVQGELQNATDAAALAGARSYVNGDEDQAEPDATEVAASNTADGRSVSSSTANTTVTVNATAPDIDEGTAGTVQVDATMRINHLLAPIFGRRFDTVQAHSKAEYSPVITTLAANQAFPIAVSLDQWPNGPNGNGVPLNQVHPGEDAIVVVRPSGNPGRNGVWTPFFISSANTNTYVHLIEQNLGLEMPTEDFFIPSLTAGESLIHLDNGNNVGTGINAQYENPIKAKAFLTMPVISGFQYNQSVLVRGFITMKVTDVDYQSGAYTIRGRLVKGVVKGFSGTRPTTGDPDADIWLRTISPGFVKLVPID